MGWSDLGLPVVPSVCVDAMFVPLILVCSLMILMIVSRSTSPFDVIVCFGWKVTHEPEVHSDSSTKGQTIRLSEILSSQGPASTVAHQNPSPRGNRGQPWSVVPAVCCKPAHQTVLIV